MIQPISAGRAHPQREEWRTCRSEVTQHAPPAGTIEAQLRALVATLDSADDASAAVRLSGVVLDETVDGYRLVVLRQHRQPGPHRAALSKREFQIAQMVAGGHSNKMIAVALAISLSTVSTYLRRIFNKLQVSTRASMVAQIAMN